MLMTLLGGLVIGYLVGSLPFGVWIPHLLRKGDPRTIGSENIGATNVYRLAGLKTAALVGSADFLKGGLLVSMLPSKYTLAAAMGCVVGHVFPWILKFKGGKGVATACGILVFLMPMNAIIAIGIWVVLWRKTGYASVASLGAVLANLALTWLFYSGPYRLFALFLTTLIFYTHRHNLKRLVTGTEHRFRG